MFGDQRTQCRIFHRLSIMVEIEDCQPRQMRSTPTKRQLSKTVLILILAALAGCSGRPAALKPPNIDPDDFADNVLKQCDTSGDGIISSNELDSAPSLKFALNRIDSDRNQQISKEEISAFAQKHWIDAAAGIVRVRCEVNMGGRPVDGATVTLEPEKFMGGVINPAVAVTRGGQAPFDVSDEHRPHPNAHGAQIGLYLVRISKIVNGKETIPAKYNEQTTLGCEVADRASYMPGPIVFNL